MRWILAGLLLAGCAKPAPQYPIGLIVESLGQCVESVKGSMLSFEGKRVRYACENQWVLLGQPYIREGERFILGARIQPDDEGLKVGSTREFRVIRTIGSRCELTPASGRCRAYFPKYYFDPSSGRCKEFIWGGCGGAVPFHSMRECETNCVAP